MDRVDVNLPLEILPKEAIPPHTQENIDFESLRINPRMHVIKEEPWMREDNECRERVKATSANSECYHPKARDPNNHKRELDASVYGLEVGM